MLDKIIALISPFYCISCSQKGYLLCEACQVSALTILPSRCYRCHKSTTQFKVCDSCRRRVKLKRLFVVSPYEGLSTELIDIVKFERAMTGTKDIGRAIYGILPIFDENTIICHVPTAQRRIRIRGYDQSLLIAKEISKSMNLELRPLIVRQNNLRQLGASRKVRFKQAEQSYKFNIKFDIKGKNILVIDDVTTSGATIESIAKILKESGANEVNGAVFAQAMD